MVGRNLSLAFPPKTGKTRATRLEVEGFSSPGHFQNVSFSVAAGEIVGLGGIQGNGQREIARALYGLLPVTGQVRLNGSRRFLSSPGQAIRSGIVYVPADRRGEGLFVVTFDSGEYRHSPSFRLEQFRGDGESTRRQWQFEKRSIA